MGLRDSGRSGYRVEDLCGDFMAYREDDSGLAMIYSELCCRCPPSWEERSRGPPL